MKQHIARILLGLAISAFFIGHAVQAYRIGLIDRLDNIVYDAWLNLTMPRGVYDRVVILDIDEKSLGEIGRWPWSRNVMADLIDRLFDRYGVSVVGFDVVWAERDTSSGMQVLDRLAHEELKREPGFQGAYRRVRPKRPSTLSTKNTVSANPPVRSMPIRTSSAVSRNGASRCRSCWSVIKCFSRAVSCRTFPRSATQ